MGADKAKRERNGALLSLPGSACRGLLASGVSDLDQIDQPPRARAHAPLLIREAPLERAGLLKERLPERPVASAKLLAQ